ncbi:hypothetical protein MKK84_31730 [Methylobacterium sp. E-065]|uniref:hypothetical protein n=1 Tax=Methylobacterium sp. E-065 TaxID=2836583 RepID=UPI001FB9559B|nr:hypothetical protein [Methylobacterium sp. E-065]MCJ2021922.1 hypothetical protein [Methylobacterium sp. E-065]
MKTVLAALAIAVLAASPTFASGTPDLAREAGKPATVQMADASNLAPAPVAQATLTEKIRVVLASPCCN